MKPLSLEEINFFATQPITDRTELGRINLRLLHTAREYHRLRDIAQKQVDRWYRDPPQEEGGDFIAGMYRLREALKETEISVK